MAINKVGSVSIFVEDQDRAKAFYRDTLDMELRLEAPLGPDTTARWISVAPKGAETEIVLYLMDEHWEHYRQTMGKSQALTLEVEDMQAVYRDLSAKGVTFIQKPEQQKWGTFAMILDSEGNMLILTEEPKA